MWTSLTTERGGREGGKGGWRKEEEEEGHEEEELVVQKSTYLCPFVDQSMTPYTALFKSGLLLENRGILLGKQYWCGFGKLMSENKRDRDDL